MDQRGKETYGHKSTEEKSNMDQRGKVTQKWRLLKTTSKKDQIRGIGVENPQKEQKREGAD